MENCYLNVLTQTMLFSIPRQKSAQTEDISRQREDCCLSAFVPTNSKLN